MARPCKHIVEALPPAPRIVYAVASIAATLLAAAVLAAVTVRKELKGS